MEDLLICYLPLYRDTEGIINNNLYMHYLTTVTFELLQTRQRQRQLVHRPISRQMDIWTDTKRQVDTQTYEQTDTLADRELDRTEVG